MRIKLKELIFKHKNIPCVIVGSGPTMLDFDYSKFKGIIIIAGSAILRINKLVKPDYLVSSNNHFPVVEIDEHVKILNKFKRLKWMISDTGCYDSIWKFNEDKFKKKLKLSYFLFDDRHFKNKECKPKKNCCDFLKKYPGRKIIYEYLSQIYKQPFKLKETGISAAEISTTFALIFGCNPIFIQGVDIPKKHYFGKEKGRQYFGKKNNSADMVLDRTLDIIRKKYFIFYLKKLNFLEYFRSFKTKFYNKLTNRSLFYTEFHKSIKMFNWLSKIGNSKKIKIINLSAKSNLKKTKYIKYMSQDEVYKKYNKFFK